MRRASRRERQRRIAAALGAAALIAGLSYMAGRARAGGPSSQALTYSGVLEDGGAPVDGERSIQLHLWDDPLSADPVHRRCSIIPTQPTKVTEGRFEIVFTDLCTDAVRAADDLYLEVVVEGQSLARSRLGAVPYALEAMRARDVTPELRQSLAPSGMVVAFAGPTPPQGWLLCDGAEVDRGTYADLFAAIGTAHGAGDGATTFHLPDLRGRFLRGVDRGAARDPDVAARAAAAPGGNAGDAVGSIEPTAMSNHGHAVNDPSHAHAEIIAHGAPGGFLWTNAQAGGFASLAQSNVPTAAAYTGISIGGPVGATVSSESRPENAAVHFIIKF